ncbi:TAP-like protein-domain-containing protein [Talaromyces proteolyticus]|uniref:TAP-like protein-domain-containing protein n=1 Tax=Talaromyces proteolyticus TaxID=1131652 RepID=A0AAD4PSK7_9EURO|nr:TAP-like protein-domain-containing protein [Talaromyces proteolyticus]KAH8689176.1 TAP-like protein-domain-containing protein [Talaromyces proteolyticus]
MFSSRFPLFQLSPVLIFAAAAASSSSNASTVIQWGTCVNDFESTLPADCGTLLLLRIPATVQPAKGSIVLNFGGPGEAGRSTVAETAIILQGLSGGQYNLISFDPRGTPNSNLPFSCFDTDFARQAQAQGQSLPDIDNEEALAKLWARATIDATACAKKQKTTGELIGTAFTARDVLSIAENLGEDGMVRYWGYSYGTTLGATLVSMFPEKIDKVILDGVQNPHEYYHSYGDIEEWAQSDQVFSGIFTSCLQEPDACPLAYYNPTAAELENKVWTLFDTLKTHPVPVGDLIVDENVLHGIVSNSLYSTSSWKNTTRALDMLLTGNIDEELILNLASAVVPVDQATLLAATSIYSPLEGIHCSDRAARAGTYENLLPTLRELANTSRIMGRTDMSLSMVCAQWTIDPKERYEGDFQVSPANPVLLIGNAYDGHTPIQSARNVSSGFEGSVVLEVNGYGHSSLGVPSLCSLKTQADYWVNGTLPEPGTVCQPESAPFSEASWLEVISKAYGA